MNITKNRFGHIEISHKGESLCYVQNDIEVDGILASLPETIRKKLNSYTDISVPCSKDIFELLL